MVITTKDETNQTNSICLPRLFLMAVTSEGVIAECYKNIDFRVLFQDVDLVTGLSSYRITKPLDNTNNIFTIFVHPENKSKFSFFLET